MWKRILQTFCLFFVLGAVAARAQAPTQPQLDYVTWTGDEINKMVDTHIDLFVGEGQGMLWSIFAVLLVWYILVGLFSSSIRNELLVELVMNTMLASMMLTFYDTPMPWGGGFSFHQIFAKEAAWAAGTLDITMVSDIVKTVVTIFKSIDLPHFLDLFALLTYLETVLNLGLIWLFCSGITLIAHIALGFGALMGSLLIPFFIWPVMNWLFWGWVRFMTTYALYIISSSAVVYLYAHVITYFFTHFIGGDYSLGNFSALLLPFSVLNGVFLIAFWQCHTWARDLATGSASMGSSVNSMVQAAAFAILA
jgi:hypothetical protein